MFSRRGSSYRFCFHDSHSANHLLFIHKLVALFILIVQARKGAPSWKVVSGWKRYIDGTTENGSDPDEDQQKQEEREENECERVVPSFACHASSSEEIIPHISSKNHIHHHENGPNPNDGPINSETARREMKEFGRGYYHHLVATSLSRNMVNDSRAVAAAVAVDESSLFLSQADRSLPSPPRTIDLVSVATRVGAGVAGTWPTSSSNQYETDPDLRIPVNGEFVHLAQ